LEPGWDALKSRSVFSLIAVCPPALEPNLSQILVRRALSCERMADVESYKKMAIYSTFRSAAILGKDTVMFFVAYYHGISVEGLR
jgi:hypothetical protein